MFRKEPYLRYPLWRLTVFGLSVATCVSACIFIYLRKNENLRRKKYEEFFRNYDPYTHMKEICSHNPGILHSCPKDLALVYEKRKAGE